MSNEEQHEFLCEIFSELVPVLTVEKLDFLAHQCGIRIGEFYTPAEIKDFFDDLPETEVLEVINWKEAA